MPNMQATPGDELRASPVVHFNQVFRRRGFSLIELLVCIAIIAVLAVCTFSVQQRLTHSSRSTHCISNLRQVYAAIQLYMGEHSGSFPPGNAQNGTGGNWSGLWYAPNKPVNGPDVGLAIYAGGQDALNKIVVCPENRSSTIAPSMRNPIGYPYIVNYIVMVAQGSGPATRSSVILRPSVTALMVDSATGETPGLKWNLGFNSMASVKAYVENRHQGRLNTLWTDGHVSGIRKEEITVSNIENK